MKKLMILLMVFCLMFSLMACSKKNAYPSANDVKNDIMGELVWTDYDGQSPISEVKKISIDDIEDMKSTGGTMVVTATISYVTESGFENETSFEVSYKWVDNKGWVYYMIF